MYLRSPYLNMYVLAVEVLKEKDLPRRVEGEVVRVWEDRSYGAASGGGAVSEPETEAWTRRASSPTSVSSPGSASSSPSNSWIRSEYYR